MKPLLRRLAVLVNRKRFERELEEEMEHHRAMMDDPRRFGNTTLLKEDSRGMWAFVWWEQLAQDLRYGFRNMAANKLFTSMAVLSLALGIGANTAIFSFMDAILLRSLPVPHPEELVVLNWSSPGQTPVVHGINGSMYRDGKRGRTTPNFPYPSFEVAQSGGKLPMTIFAYARAYQLNLQAQNQAEVANGMYVSGGYYTGLGLRPHAGRFISADDDRAGAPPVVVISHSYWQTRFASRSDVIGSQMKINNVPFTVIGVAPAEFYGIDASMDARVTIPLRTMPLFSPKPEAEARKRFLDRNFCWLEMMGRLHPGTTQEQANLAVATSFGQYFRDNATTEKEKTGAMPQTWLQTGGTGLDSLRRQYSKPLFVLMTMVGLILAIACANIANLLLSRATARRREMAVRMSLGAGRWRVVRQLLTESVLLSCTGGFLGLGVAVLGIRALVFMMADPDDPGGLRVSLNWQVLTFTLALAVVTGIVFGLAPALQSTGGSITPALKETRASAALGGRRRFGLNFGLGHILVVAQVAISLVLAIGAGLFVKTLSSLNAVDVGFNRENILVFSLNAKQAGYKDAALAGFYKNLLDRFERVPGVRKAGLSDFPLVANYWNGTGLVIPGAPKMPEGKGPNTCVMTVNPNFLQVMQIPILLGRGIEDRDMTSPRVAVITELLAKKYFPGVNPIGRRIGLGDEKDPADIEIIGVARTTRYNSLKEETPPVAYVPYTQDLEGLSRMEFELRTTGDPLAIANTIRAIVHEANSAVPVVSLTTQAATMDRTITEERTFAQLCTGFAVLALLIAAVGLYGTMAYAVARRTNEIGIRMALGAKRPGVIWMVLRQVTIMAVVGLGVGLAVAWQTTHLVQSWIFGVKPNDPLVMAVSALILITAALAAGFAPAWRASRIDPMVALRHE